MPAHFSRHCCAAMHSGKAFDVQERQTAQSPQAHSRRAAVAHVSAHMVVGHIPSCATPQYNGCADAACLLTYGSCACHAGVWGKGLRMALQQQQQSRLWVARVVGSCQLRPRLHWQPMWGSSKCALVSVSVASGGIRHQQARKTGT